MQALLFLLSTAFNFVLIKPIASDSHCEFSHKHSVVQCKHGYFFLTEHNSGLVSQHLAEYGEWQDNNVEFLLGLLHEGNFVVDIGAHIGAYTLPFAQKVGTSGHVLALEMQHDIFQRLNANIAMNSLPNVFTRQVVVGAANSVIAGNYINITTSA
jgi:hypothetical protein